VATTQAAPATGAKTALDIRITVNGKEYNMQIEPQETLLEVLRNRLHLMGAKRSCDSQVCGTCTVLVDGMPVSACTYLAYEARGKEVTTIEGLMQDGRLHPVQQAFLENNGFQCGFCTPGMILAAVSLLRENPNPTDEEIKRYMRGNLCRCTGYVKIIESIKDAARRMNSGAA